MNDYSDIINFDYKGPKNHQRMSIENRASQFASFKALSGYEDELKEARRIVSSKIILDESKKDEINNKLKEIENRLSNDLLIKTTYFIKDLKKDGGYYKEIVSNIKKIDKYKREIVLENKERISISNILDIDIIEE